MDEELRREFTAFHTRISSHAKEQRDATKAIELQFVDFMARQDGDHTLLRDSVQKLTDTVDAHQGVLVGRRQDPGLIDQMRTIDQRQQAHLEEHTEDRKRRWQSTLVVVAGFLPLYAKLVAKKLFGLDITP